jgi:hypothetical protein
MKIIAVFTLPLLCFVNYKHPKFYVRHRDAIVIFSRIILTKLEPAVEFRGQEAVPSLSLVKVLLFRLSSCCWPIRCERHIFLVLLGAFYMNPNFSDFVNRDAYSKITISIAILVNFYITFMIELRQRRMFEIKYDCKWSKNQRWGEIGRFIKRGLKKSSSTKTA